ncbi:MAG: ABC transporter ATP-binding protein [Chloroflexi bacterium]|nr:ABC transporter ATP-binding protein [Chloroflexota bacterium]
MLELDHVERMFGGSWLGRLGGDNVVRAVDDVTLSIAAGEAFGIVGESGSGKTTVGRMIVRLLDPTAGAIRFEGQDITRLRGGALLAYRRSVQMVFQNPYLSLNPRRRVRDMLLDAYRIHHLASGRDAEERVAALMEMVGLRRTMLDRYPHEFSSGQRQRIGIARALSVEPRLIVADEPVSALDVSVQAQVLNLLRGLQEELGLTVVFISHDLRAVSFLCSRVAVLYLGQVMEVAPRRALVERAAHPYTQALMGSMPSLAPGSGITREVIRGDIADQQPPPGGCVFAPRCELRRRLGDPDRCLTERPWPRELSEGHAVACHFADAEARPDTDARPEATGAAAGPTTPTTPTMVGISDPTRVPAVTSTGATT